MDLNKSFGEVHLLNKTEYRDNETSTFTDNHTNFSYEDVLCSYEYDPDYDYFDLYDRTVQNLSKPYYSIAIGLGAIAVFANLLSLAAVFKQGHSWSSHFRLLVSLMISDLLINFSVILHVINKIVNPLTAAGIGPKDMRLYSRCGYLVVKALNTMGLNVSLLNLVGMALDHYLAIMKPLHHSTLLDKGKTSAMILSFWIIAVITGFSNFASPLWNWDFYMKSDFNYCEVADISEYHEEYTMFAIAFLCLFLMVFMYLRIYHKVQKRMHRMDLGRIRESKRALLTTLLILGSFIVCWLPSCLMQVSLIVIAKFNPDLISDAGVFNCLLVIDKYLYDLLILNTLCDTAIYVIRVKEVQAGYRKIFGCCSQPRGNMASNTSTRSRIDYHMQSNSTYINDSDTFHMEHVSLTGNLKKNISRDSKHFRASTQNDSVHYNHCREKIQYDLNCEESHYEQETGGERTKIPLIEVTVSRN